jgi:hypothetical protein
MMPHNGESYAVGNSGRVVDSALIWDPHSPRAFDIEKSHGLKFGGRPSALSSTRRKDSCVAIEASVVCVLLLGGCAASERAISAYYQIAPGNLPPTDITLNIPGLSPCTDDHSIHFASRAR